MSDKKYSSLKEFYPFYLSEHKNPVSRALHFVGTAFVILCLFTAVLFHDMRFFILVPIMAYSFATAGHFFFEKNKPATFKYPFFSLASDFLLFGDLVSGKQTFKSNQQNS